MPRLLSAIQRRLQRSPGFTLLGSAGLAIGLAVSLLTAGFVHHEWSVDAFHEQADRIVRVVQQSRDDTTTTVRGLSGIVTTPPGLAQALERQFAAVETATVVARSQERVLRTNGKSFSVSKTIRADTSFFDVFTFRLRDGDPETALSEPNQIVLTPELARRTFGDANPIGQTVEIENQATYTVTGVTEPVPDASHIQFSALLSLSSQQRALRYGGQVYWPYFHGHLYLLPEPGTDRRALERRIRQFEASQREKAPSLRLQPLLDVHLYSATLDEGIGSGGSPHRLWFVGVLGVIVLGIACINYVNLETARSTERAREVGVRKSSGATRGQLIRQFLTESVAMSLLALPLAAGLAWMASPVVASITGWTPDLPWPQASAALLGTSISAGLAAGVYPALLLSRVQPSRALSSSQQIGRREGAWLRRTLVVVQFAASAVLIVVTLAVREQLQYLQSQSLGFDTEPVVTFDTAPVQASFSAFADAVQRAPSVESVTTGPPPGLGHASLRVSPKDRSAQMYVMRVGPRYAETVGLTLQKGRRFDPAFKNDSTSVLLTASAARHLEVGDDPVGARVSIAGEQRTVVGVVGDIHNTSLHTPRDPTAFIPTEEPQYTTMVRMVPSQTRAGVEHLRTQWQRFVPDRPFAFTFLDARIDAQYRAEKRLQQVVTLFAGLALLLAALGLFGLTAYVVRRRTREIGIRKALGATAASIVRLVSNEVLVLVGVAVAVGVPVAYVAVERWLSTFAYRTSLGAEVLVAAAACVAAIVALSVGYQTYRATQVDPASSLRDE